MRVAVWATGVACLALALLEVWEIHSARGDDLSRLETSVRRLEAIGRDNAEVLVKLCQLYEAHGEPEKAIGALRRVIARHRDPALVNNLAWYLATTSGVDAAVVREAVALAEEAVKGLGEQDYTSLDTLAVSYAAAGRFQEAVQFGSRALVLARRDASPLVPELSARLALYRSRRPYRR